VFSNLMGGIYWVISQILLFWHGVWDRIMPEGRVLGTNWQWILAIVFLVVTVRIVLFPIFVKQIKSQRAMQALQPKMKELQEKHKGDRETMQKELMELYRSEKVNPLMGCLPMFLQIPVFLGLFHVLKHLDPKNVNVKTLYGWTVEQFDSAADARLLGSPIPAKFSSTVAELARLDADGITVKVVAAVLVIIMMVTTYLTSRQMIRKTGWSEDPQQRMIQRLMLYGIPLSLLVSGWAFPIGVILYWVTNNLISLGQQAWVLHKYPPPLQAGKNGAAKPGGDKAGSGKPTLGKLGKTASNGKSTSLTKRPASGEGRANGTAPAGTSSGSRGLAPRPGAKPVKPKKSGTPPRQQSS